MRDLLVTFLTQIALSPEAVLAFTAFIIAAISPLVPGPVRGVVTKAIEFLTLRIAEYARRRLEAQVVTAVLAAEQKRIDNPEISGKQALHSVRSSLSLQGVNVHSPEVVDAIESAVSQLPPTSLTVAQHQYDRARAQAELDARLNELEALLSNQE